MALSNSLLQKPKQNYQRDKRNTCADKNYQQDKYNATPVLTVFTAPGFSLSPTQILHSFGSQIAFKTLFF